MKNIANDMLQVSVYCDESHPIKNDGCDFYVIGCAIINEKNYSKFNDDITAIKKSHGYNKDFEIKWSQITGKNKYLAKDIITYVKNNDIGLRILIVPNKTEREYELYLSHEDLYSKMYYLLLSKIFLIDKYSNAGGLSIFVDRRNTYSELNARNLEKRIYYNSNIFNHSSQIVDSKEEQLVQIIDLFVGATSYERIDSKASANKMEIIEHIKSEFGLTKLNFRSSMQEDKYNVFIWDGRYAKI